VEVISGFLIAGNRIAGYSGISAEALIRDPSSGQLARKNLSDQARVARPALQQSWLGEPSRRLLVKPEIGGHRVEY